MAARKKKSAKSPKTLRKRLIEWGRALLLAILLLSALRTFVVDFRVIPSSSMEGSIRTGDFIVVTKCSFGARVPFTDGDWRLPGFSDIERNDVLVFIHPWEDPNQPDRYENLTKRCVGLPGEHIEVHSKSVHINGEFTDSPTDLQQNYWVETLDDSILLELIKRFDITEGGPFRGEGLFRLACSQAQADSLEASDAVTGVTPVMEKPGVFRDHVFPQDVHFPWNNDFLGPLYIPKAGDSIELTPKNVILYQRIIRRYEGHKLSQDELVTKIDGEPATHYRFEQNYYWMMGDNRDLSNDSRSWGFLPENHIIGKAWFVLFSLDKSDPSWFPSLRWGRFFKGID